MTYIRAYAHNYVHMPLYESIVRERMIHEGQLWGEASVLVGWGESQKYRGYVYQTAVIYEKGGCANVQRALRGLNHVPCRGVTVIKVRLCMYPYHRSNHGGTTHAIMEGLSPSRCVYCG